jgi:hypothetical protein
VYLQNGFCQANHREAGLDDATLAERLLVIEWFPYHLKKSALSTKPVCESQNYSFQLANEMLEKKKLAVGMRSMKHWVAVDQQFGRTVQFLKNPQCGYISRGNTEGDLFDRIVKALEIETALRSATQRRHVSCTEGLPPRSALSSARCCPFAPGVVSQRSTVVNGDADGRHAILAFRAF